MNDYAMIKHDVQPNTSEWLALREKYRTASEAPIVLGISPWTSPRDFKLIKAGLKKQYYSKAMRLGHELEEQVRQHASDHFDIDFVEAVYTRNGYLASLDGIGNDTVLEIKVSDHTFNHLSDGDMPEHYFAQVQQQLYCSGAKVGYLYVYSPKRDEYICSRPIEPMPIYMESIAEAWDKFEAMPLPDDAPMDLTGDGFVENLFAEYAYLKSEADNLKAKMDDIKAKLIEASNEHSLVVGDYSMTKSKPRVTTDYAKACKDAKLDLSSYKKEGESSYTIKLPKNPFLA